MNTSSARYRVPMALIGSLWGLACAITILVLRLASSAPPPSSKVDVLLHALIVSAVYAMPFALGLIALRWGTSLQLASSLAASAILAVFGSLSAMSGLTLLICPAAP